jgi:type IV pilus assembly protein PilB
MAAVDPLVPAPAATDLPGLARALVLAGQLGQTAAQTLYQKAQKGRTSFIAELTGSGAVSSSDLAHLLSSTFAVPLVDLDKIDPARLPQGLLDPRICRNNRVVVLGQRQNRLTVITADPSDQQAAEKIKFATQLGVDWVVAEFDKLLKLANTLASTATNQVISPLSSGSLFDESPPDSREHPQINNTEAEDLPVVLFLQQMLLDAVTLRASDLHFEPYEQSYRVRFRVDGELREIAKPPVAIKDRLASRIKVISRMDISEKRLPQDGKMKLEVAPGRVIDFRVSTLPTLFGEKIVIRVLDPYSVRMGIETLGYEFEEEQRLLQAITRTHGMILVTGPTGSGKTLSLYTCLNLLNQPGVNIATVEDPCEMNLPGVNQVNVNDKAGMTFAVALKSFLRQDPDIIMVGEIRDIETADIAIKAAQTGHLVLSSLHTNDAPATLTRLRHMGMAPFNIAASVTLITAQRLARRLCMHCKIPIEIADQILHEAGCKDDKPNATVTFYRPVGCGRCNHGYHGRVGLYQVMPISEALQRIILRDGNALEVAEQAGREGVRTLRQAGLHKARLGLTSLEEVLAVTPD